MAGDSSQRKSPISIVFPCISAIYLKSFPLRGMRVIVYQSHAPRRLRLFGFKKKDKKVIEDAAVQPSEKQFSFTFKNDILGADEWKKSKIGYLSGYGASKKALGTVGTAVSGTAGRLSTMYRMLTGKNERSVPGLDDPAVFKDANERFQAAMKLQRITESTLVRIQRNTFRAAYFYILLTLALIVIAGGSLIAFPTINPIEILGRFALTPVLLALVFKNCFTNWCVRNRVATGPTAYFKSGQLFPKS
jgi:hypothetical protein